MSYILFPGRHHLFTKFQWDQLARIANCEVADVDGNTIPFEAPTVLIAITSANHSNTRRNPVPVELRAAQAHLAARQAGLDAMTVSVPDVGTTDRFAEYIIGAIAAEESVSDADGNPLHISSANCVLACSTPSVVRQFDAMGFAVFAMEHEGDPRLGPATGDDLWTAKRPWQIVELTLAEERPLESPMWTDTVHDASTRVWQQHHLHHRVDRLFAGPIVDGDSDLTSGRDYFTYVDSFDRGAERKWELLEPHVVAGRIVDVGCAAGAMMALAGETPRLAESDLIGIELSRALYDECVHRRRMGAFANPNTFFYHRNAMEQLFPDRSIDTTITVSLTHEIVSYLNEDALDQLSRSIYDHTTPGGVWLIYDVCAPAEPDRVVRMMLDDVGGVSAADAALVDHKTLSTEELGPWLDTLSVRARFDVFATTFRAEQGESLDAVGSVDRRADGSVQLRLADAMDFLAHHTYTESWRSEMNERFCYRNLDEWRKALTTIGFEIDPASTTWTNPWLAEHRFGPVASLRDPATGNAVDWGETNLVVVARRP